MTERRAKRRRLVQVELMPELWWLVFDEAWEWSVIMMAQTNREFHALAGEYMKQGRLQRGRWIKHEGISDWPVETFLEWLFGPAREIYFPTSGLKGEDLAIWQSKWGTKIHQVAYDVYSRRDVRPLLPALLALVPQEWMEPISACLMYNAASEDDEAMVTLAWKNAGIETDIPFFDGVRVLPFLRKLLMCITGQDHIEDEIGIDAEFILSIGDISSAYEKLLALTFAWNSTAVLSRLLKMHPDAWAVPLWKLIKDWDRAHSPSLKFVTLETVLSHVSPEEERLPLLRHLCMTALHVGDISNADTFLWLLEKSGVVLPEIKERVALARHVLE